MVVPVSKVEPSVAVVVFFIEILKLLNVYGLVNEDTGNWIPLMAEFAAIPIVVSSAAVYIN